MHPLFESMSSLTHKLKILKGIVKDWEKRQVLEKSNEILDIGLEIQSLLSTRILGILTDREVAQLSYLKSRKDTLLAHQVLTWRLKSRINWINEGDTNTKLFQTYASTRRNSKSIWALQN